MSEKPKKKTAAEKKADKPDAAAETAKPVESKTEKASAAAPEKAPVGEDKAKPLSDREIAEALEKKGVTIARRTVVKYREQLGILSGPLRKQH